MSNTVDMAAELGCTEMTTFIIDETDLTIGFYPTSVKAITIQIEQSWDDKSKNSAAIWFTPAVARRLARALIDAADRTEK